MSRAKLVLVCVTLAILMVSVLAACAPAATTTPAKPATTEKPATTPPAQKPTTLPPTTPPAPPAASPAIKTSYEAKTYTNDKYGFSFQYPAAMTAAPEPKAKYGVFEAAEPMAVPAVSASVLDTDKVEAQSEESLKSVGGSDIKTVSTTDITLADGKTKAKLTELAWKSSGYDITTWSVAVDKGDGKTVSVSYTSLKDMIDTKVAQECVKTLVIK